VQSRSRIWSYRITFQASTIWALKIRTNKTLRKPATMLETSLSHSSNIKVMSKRCFSSFAKNSNFLPTTYLRMDIRCHRSLTTTWDYLKWAFKVLTKSRDWKGIQTFINRHSEISLELPRMHLKVALQGCLPNSLPGLTSSILEMSCWWGAKISRCPILAGPRSVRLMTRVSMSTSWTLKTKLVKKTKKDLLLLKGRKWANP